MGKFSGDHIIKMGHFVINVTTLLPVIESHSCRTLWKLNKIEYFNIKSPVLDYTPFTISYKFEAIAFCQPQV